MVGSFIALLIGLVFHLTISSLVSKFSFLADWTRWTLIAVNFLAVVFVVITIIKVISIIVRSIRR